MNDITNLDINVREATLEQKFTKGLVHQLAVVLCLSLMVLVPVEIWLYSETESNEYEQLKNGARLGLKSLANIAVMGIDPEAHAEIFDPGDEQLDEFIKIRDHLLEVRKRAELKSHIYTLRLDDADKRIAKFVVMTNPKTYVGTGYIYPPEMEKAIFLGIPTYTDIYESSSVAGGYWMSAFAPFMEPDSGTYCILEIDISLDELKARYEAKMQWLRWRMILQGIAIVLVFMLIYYLIYRNVSGNMRRLVAEPLSYVLDFVARVGKGNLLSSVMIRSGDELEVVGDSLNQMVSGLRQRETMSKFLTGMELKEVQEISSGHKSMSYEGEKKSVTVLFSDIRGFTTICEKSDPKLIIDSLNFYFGKMVPIVEEHGGSIDKLIGDAVMAVFESKEDYHDASAGLMAAIQMQAAMTEYRRQMTSLGMPEFYIGIGVNTGVSVVGNLGAKDQVSRTVLGDSVNLAARVESLSKQGKQSNILFTEFTLDQLKTPPKYDFLMETIVKGKSEPVKIYEVSETVILDWKSCNSVI